MNNREHSQDLLQRIVDSLPLEVEPEAPAPDASSDGANGAAAAKTGGPVLSWNEEDQCSLTFDDDLALVMTLNGGELEEDGVLLLTWVLGNFPEDLETRADVMLDLLLANNEWNMTEGGTLGVDEGTGYVTLCYRVDLPLDPPDQIDEIVAKLYNVSRHWANVLNAAEPAAEETPAEGAAPEPVAQAAPAAAASGSVRDRL